MESALFKSPLFPKFKTWTVVFIHVNIKLEVISSNHNANFLWQPDQMHDSIFVSTEFYSCGNKKSLVQSYLVYYYEDTNTGLEFELKKIIAII